MNRGGEQKAVVGRVSALPPGPQQRAAGASHAYSPGTAPGSRCWSGTAAGLACAGRRGRRWRTLVRRREGRHAAPDARPICTGVGWWCGDVTGGSRPMRRRRASRRYGSHRSRTATYSCSGKRAPSNTHRSSGGACLRVRCVRRARRESASRATRTGREWERAVRVSCMRRACMGVSVCRFFQEGAPQAPRKGPTGEHAVRVGCVRRACMRESVRRFHQHVRACAQARGSVGVCAHAHLCGACAIRPVLLSYRPLPAGSASPAWRQSAPSQLPQL